VAGVCPAGDRSSGSEVTDPDVGCISVGYDEDCSIEGPDMFMTRFPSLAGVCAELVGSNPGFGLIVKK